MRKIIHREKRYKKFGGYTAKRFPKAPKGLVDHLHTSRSVPESLTELEQYEEHKKEAMREYKKKYNKKYYGY